MLPWRNLANALDLSPSSVKGVKVRFLLVAQIKYKENNQMKMPQKEINRIGALVFIWTILILHLYYG